MHYIIALILLGMGLIVFYIMGDVVTTCSHVKQMLAFKLVLGAFVFFAIINPLYLICVFFRFNVNVLCIFISCIIVVFCASYVCMAKERQTLIIDIVKYVSNNKLNVIIAVLSTAIILYYCIRFCYYGWDTTYYIKEISNTAKFGTLYQYWTTGSLGNAIKLKHALCSYYMVLAVFSRITAVPAIIVARVVGGGTCVVLYAMTTYCFGKELFKNDNEALLFVVLCNILNGFYVSIYTSSAFLMERSYEGKAWCSNVIIPFLLLLFLRMFIYGLKDNWVFVGIVAFACDSISMSMLIMAPVLITVGFGCLLCTETEKMTVIRNWCICIMPLALYCLLIYLESRKWFLLLP